MSKVSQEKNLNWYSSPYTLREKIQFLRYRIGHPKRRPYSRLLNTLEQERQLYSDKAPSLTITFLGDIMPINDCELKLTEELNAFIGTSDFLVVNLEGVITTKKRFLALSHDESIIKKIRKLSEGDIVINLANNHASDFGCKPFNEQVKRLQAEGFSLVGIDTSPLIIQNKVLLAAGTLWSNQALSTCARFSLSETPKLPPAPHLYSIFMPHWGYEMELHPTDKQIAFANKTIAEGWQSIVGNHTHCPQPIQLIENGVVAYSLGNFCYLNRNPNHHYGVALKLSFYEEDNRLKLQAVERRYTLQSISKNTITISCSPKLDYRVTRKAIRPTLQYLNDLLK